MKPEPLPKVTSEFCWNTALALLLSCPGLFEPGQADADKTKRCACRFLREQPLCMLKNLRGEVAWRGQLRAAGAYPEIFRLEFQRYPRAALAGCFCAVRYLFA